MRYQIRDRQAGNLIEEAATFEEARQIILEFEKDDEKEGTYTPDFYEIYDTEKEDIISDMDRWGTPQGMTYPIQE